MVKENVINKKKVAICIIIFILFVVLITISIWPKNKNSINAIIINDNTKLYSSPREDKKNIKLDNIEKNTHVNILNSVIENNIEWYEVKIGGKKGYILSENIDYFKNQKIEDDSLVLVPDFSSHNLKNIFKNENDVEAFLLKYDISYVYIRAGGRGYGDEGNFYTDEKYKVFKNACEYLGIKYGYYFLEEALNVKEINEEVEFIDKFMTKNKSNLCTLPVALDIEKHDEKGRCDDIWETRSNIVSKLIKKIDNKGYNTIVYSNANTCNTYLSSLKTKFWLAYYPEEPYIPDFWYSKTTQPATSNSNMMKKMIGWQFSENGVKHVMREGVDLSIFKGSFLNTY